MVKPTLRIVVALLGGLAALVVAATVLSVAATTFQAAAREVGVKYIRSTLQTASALLEEYFSAPVRDIEMIAAQYASMDASANLVLPSEREDINASSTRYCEPLRTAQLVANSSYESLGLFFDDGSVVALPSYNRTSTTWSPSGLAGGPILSCFMVSSWNGVGRYSEVNWYSRTLETVPDGTIPLAPSEVDVDNKPSVYATAVGVALQKPIRPFWAPPQAFRAHTFAAAFLTLAVSRAMFNSSGHFLGLFAIATSMNDLSAFLRTVDRSPGTQLFAMDNSFYIHGTTHPEPVARIYVTNTQAVPRGCLSTAAVSPSPTPGIVCPKAATEFPYAPLQTFMGSAGAPTTLSKLKAGDTYLTTLDVTGQAFQSVLAVTSIPNDGKTFGLNLLAFVDLEDVEGDLRAGIQTAIGISAGIFVAGVATIMLMLYVVLKPLEKVARDMDDTAKLRIKEDDGDDERDALLGGGNADDGAGEGDAEMTGMSPRSLTNNGSGAFGDGGFSGGMARQATTNSNAGFGDDGMLRQQSSMDGMVGQRYAEQQARKRGAGGAGGRGGRGGAGGAGGLSGVAEIAALQVAYAGLSAAVGSFVKYVPREVVRELIASNKLAALGMEKVERATIMFSHIAGFEEISARVLPSELAGPVALYFDVMYETLTAFAGVIDKYIADGIMTIWGAPRPCENQELKAALCALCMARAAVVDGPLKHSFDSVGELLSVRVGLAAGPVIAGNMGSKLRHSWTALGNTCNLASRTLGTNKRFATRVLATDTVVHAAPAVLSRALIGVKVVGKNEAVMMHELVGVMPGLDLSDDAAMLSRGVLAAREWDAASDAASYISVHGGDDGGAAAAKGDGHEQSATGTNNSADTSAVSTTVGGAAAAASANGGGTGAPRCRIFTHATGAKLLRKAVALAPCSIVATAAEVHFCERYTSAANAFNSGNARLAIQMLDDLQRASPEFFDETPERLIALVGHERCEAGLVRAWQSAKVLRANAQRCVDDPGADHVMTATGK